MDDMARRGRAKYVRGETHGKSKLNAEKVKEIRALRNSGYGLVAIGKMYGMHHTTIAQIVHGKTWRHVP